MLMHALLAVDDDALVDRLRTALDGLEVVASRLPAGAKLAAEAGREAPDLIVTTGSALPEPVEISIAELRNLPNRPEVVVVSDQRDLSERARLLAAGALAVIGRTLPNDRLISTLSALIDRHRLVSIDQLELNRRAGAQKLGSFATESRPMRELLALAKKVAQADTSLLVLGETGVGKEWLGRAIHGAGSRHDKAFVAVNPAALPEQLLESELFGHEKGAFTGATRPRRGAFELAHGGTLFLDEIGDMPLHLQIKLLRVLQERKIQRLGSEHLIEIDVRLMAATNQDLNLAMEEKRFRQDLYYRLNVMTLTVPPLRSRADDVPLLIETYLDQFRRQLRRPEIVGTSVEAMKALQAYAWPGNVRELINVVERAVLLCEGELITLEELPSEISNPAPSVEGPAVARTAQLLASHWHDRPLAEARDGLIAEFERTYLAGLLESTGGNVGETAARAGIEPRTLYNKMKLYGLRKEAFKQ